MLSRFCFPSKAERFEGPSMSAGALLELSLLCSVTMAEEPGNIALTDASTHANVKYGKFILMVNKKVSLP